MERCHGGSHSANRQCRRPDTDPQSFRPRRRRLCRLIGAIRRQCCIPENSVPNSGDLRRRTSRLSLSRLEGAVAARGQEPIVPAAPRKRNLFTYMVGGVGIVATTIGFANNLWDFWEGVTRIFGARASGQDRFVGRGSLARARAAAASFTAVASPPWRRRRRTRSATGRSNLRPWQVAPKTPPADPAPRLADSNARPWQVAPKTPPADPAPRLADSNLRPWQVAPKAPPADPAPRLADSNPRPWQIVPKTPQVALPRSLRLPDAVGLRGRIMVQWTTPTGGAHLAEITMNGGSGEATIVAPDLLGLGFATERLSLREVVVPPIGPDICVFPIVTLRHLRMPPTTYNRGKC